MNGSNYIADTNALIYLLAGNTCMKPYLNKRLGLSIISEIEMLSFSGITVSEEKCIQSMLKECSVIPLNEGIKNQTVTLRRRYEIKIPDAIVAATAMECKLPLLTADKNFRQIELLDLILLNPQTA